MQIKIFDNDRKAKRYVKRCLREYPENLKKIKRLKDDLIYLEAMTDVTGQQYHKVFLKTNHSDPVVKYIEKLEAVEEKIENLKRVTEPITQMIKNLTKFYSLEGSLNFDLMKILELHFFKHISTEVAYDVLGWSRMSFFRKKDEVVRLAQKYLGY